MDNNLCRFDYSNEMWQKDAHIGGRLEDPHN